MAEEIVLIHHAQIKTDGMAQWKIKIDHATTLHFSKTCNHSKQNGAY